MARSSRARQEVDEEREVREFERERMRSLQEAGRIVDGVVHVPMMADYIGNATRQCVDLVLERLEACTRGGLRTGRSRHR